MPSNRPLQAPALTVMADAIVGGAAPERLIR